MTTRCDYLVVGCGASSMAFVDVMLRESDATFVIVDKRAAPGGHWNDAYPFVRLHQPSAFYGVASRDLGRRRVDATGGNQGLQELASGTSVTDYFHAVMAETFLPSGRVRYHPMSEWVGDGAFVSLLSGVRQSVEVNKAVVDGTALSISIPLTHRRKFSVAEGVACIAPNDLTRAAPGCSQFTVLGAGKTAIDCVLWLLSHGAAPQSIRWVMPRDPWLLNRATMQPGLAFFDQSMGAMANQVEIMATATGLNALCERMEASGGWMRLDRSVWPKMFHGATVTELELEQLKQVSDVVRLGRVQHIEPEGIVLDKGRLAAMPGAIYVDCTASALGASVDDRTPVFSPGRICLRMIRLYQPTFSAALIAHLEATTPEAADKQALAQYVPMTDTVSGWVSAMVTSLGNQAAWAQDKALREWVANCRLDQVGDTLRQIDPQDMARQAIRDRLRASTGPARANLARLATPDIAP